ncbi:MAG: glutamate racemase [Candidatus Omnitrophica bacterium]|nr:glutamate racemase [Candidatus Omnitrophota bacterium]
MTDPRPIGIFDSGVGGLTVVSRVRQILPKENIVYFGDTARVPYGTKSKETVTRFSVENVEFLMRHDVKLIIVACNTASSLSLEFLKRCFRVPILGVIEPGAKAAARYTRTNRIGVIGTSATIASGAYEKAIGKLRSGKFIYSQSCPLFVPIVEEGWLDTKIARDVASIYLNGLRAKRVDTLILGCTHYPLLKNVIGKIMGKETRLVDSAEEVAREARSVLEAGGLLNNSKKSGTQKFFVSDEPHRFTKMAHRFLKCRIRCVKAESAAG